MTIKRAELNKLARSNEDEEPLIVSKNIIRIARQWLQALENLDIRDPLLYPTLAGGLQLAWERDGFNVLLTLKPDSEAELDWSEFGLNGFAHISTNISGERFAEVLAVILKHAFGGRNAESTT